MIYSATTEYAIRALAHMASLDSDQRILARNLAEATDVPRQFLGKILHRLARMKILDSAKGRGGGFRFLRPPADICLGDVVEALEGTDITERCVLGLDECSDEQRCPMHDQWKNFKGVLTETLYGLTVEDLGRNLAAKRIKIDAKR